MQNGGIGRTGRLSGGGLGTGTPSWGRNRARKAAAPRPVGLVSAGTRTAETNFVAPTAAGAGAWASSFPDHPAHPPQRGETNRWPMTRQGTDPDQATRPSLGKAPAGRDEAVT